ncbi:DNA polymerase zeta catalytic subunit isoform X2 [Battus philenor]|uniref:DNA polymerase zeta catalytic subunit isoform X2 n=1 Tax=Battus philenor TaxID=42288 RepID=UPI0035CEF361
MDSSSTNCDNKQTVELSNVTDSTLTKKPEFSLRIVVCDHYLTKPIPGIDVIYSEFRGSDIKQVPVLRVFGPTPDGRKACLHIHGVFPYFYLPCPTQDPEPQYLYQIAASLDKALNIAFKQATSANQHVYKISLVKGLPFYGFHDKEHLYLKVFLYNPGLIKQAVELCSNGAILGQPLQPHESHLNFTLQFFIDFNLFGMSNIDLQKVKFRRSGISQISNVSIDNLDEINLKPESVCYFEADCVASHIINRQRIGKADGIENPGLEEVWNQEIERRKQLNMSVASKTLSQVKDKTDETDSHYKFQNMFLAKNSNLLDKPVDTGQKLSNDVVDIYYPAEIRHGSQFFNATDISTHIPEDTLNLSINKMLNSYVNDAVLDSTIVDENIALNSSFSLHYSQVILDSEDLDLVDLLQDLEDKVIDEDSVMGTPADGVQNKSDAELEEEYSQVFNDDTIFLDPEKCEDVTNGYTSSWNDSFWEGANIPQLDGTCDDDHVKKVRKRKMRSFKLGLSKPKSRSDPKPNAIDKYDQNMDKGTPDKTIGDVNKVPGALRSETNQTLMDCNSHNSKNVKDISVSHSLNQYNAYLNSQGNGNVMKQGVAIEYDKDRQFEPVAGSSKLHLSKKESMNLSEISDNDSFESPVENDDMDIKSFYNTSKIFDVSSENSAFLEKSTVDCDDEKTCDITIDTLGPPNNFTSNKSIIITPKVLPPSKTCVMYTSEHYGIPKHRNPKPFYSNYKDVGDKVEIGQMVIKLYSNLAQDQEPFEKILNTTSIEEWRQLLFLQQTNEMSDVKKPEILKSLLAGNTQCILEPVKKAPTRYNVMDWAKQQVESSKPTNSFNNCKEISKNLDELESSQVIGLNEDDINNSTSLELTDKENKEINCLQVTMQPDGSFLCFGSVENQGDSILETPTVEVDFLTLMLVEVHTSVRYDLNPDPAIDAIQAIFIYVKNDCPSNHFLQKSISEVLVVDSLQVPKYLDRCIFDVNVTYIDNEVQCLEKLIELVKKHDPDIMCGYEIEMNSWGYIIERAQNLGMEIVKEISRITEKNRQKRWRNDDSELEGRVIGRITFNVWRLFRHELALSSYSFENCMFVILNERVPTYSYAQLAEWWNDESRLLRWIPVEYYLTKLSGTVKMLEKLDMINRTSELARLFGLQWWEVLSRGSQFRVESLMLRAARPLNLVALSPTVRQRAAMRAPECLPLIFEPESRFYSDPVIVLDFQSLYPSMMIAYNYCFSTCIGRVQNINRDSPYEFGAWRLRIPKTKLDTLVQNELVHWSPVGVGFIKSSVRRGVLPALLRRILAARQAVKKNMKMQTDEAVKKSMHSRQLGLKLIANVTYGYTAANFSGRMPCVEVGDSVVAKGRETLERAIKLVENNSKWKAKVIYGDTDSMFVLVPGADKSRAFEIGQEIADAVTADNPSPVALKLEKVYKHCILQTKKRYVGYMYESPEQEKPIYEAKGIETVRRDGCPAGVKLLQQSLCELFDTGDMSRVKRIVCTTLSRLIDGTLPPGDLFFTREYHGPTGYRSGGAAPPNEIAKRLISRDPRSVPRTGWRVAWQVCAGPPGTALSRLARSPYELLHAPAQPHVAYYATRVLLPPLHRCLSLLGVHVSNWWMEVGYGREIQLERGMQYMLWSSQIFAM